MRCNELADFTSVRYAIADYRGQALQPSEAGYAAVRSSRSLHGAALYRCKAPDKMKVRVRLPGFIESAKFSEECEARRALVEDSRGAK